MNIVIDWLSQQLESLRELLSSGVGLNFGHPEALLLLLVLPLISWWRKRKRKSQPAIPFSAVSLLANASKVRASSNAFAGWLRTLAISALVVAVAQPRSGARVENIAREGIDIALAVDISSSMLAEDFQPHNRIEVAREEVKRFVMGRRSDRIGLVAFSGEALTQVPLTTDYPVVLSAIDNLQVGQLEDGTAIGTAIATTANRLRNAPGRSRVIVLLTDGENNRGSIDPRTAAQAASAFGIRIYTIGVGSEGMASVPVGRGLFGLRYENRPVRIDEKLLTEIADVTGGRYFRARDAQSLQSIYGQIDQLERSVVQARSFVRYTEQYRWPLAVSLMAIVGELWFLSRRGVLP